MKFLNTSIVVLQLELGSFNIKNILINLYIVYGMWTLDQIQQKLSAQQLAGHIYCHQSDQILVLQEPFTPDGEALNIFVQHEHTADQIGLQFAVQLVDQQIRFLVGVTHSNQDPSSEISIGHLRGKQQAFNLCYAFYNYPKHFYVIETDLHANTAELLASLDQQLFQKPEVSFINSSMKINPMGQSYAWIKQYIEQLTLDMKVRIQTSLI